jgi:hypothetical protein
MKDDVEQRRMDLQLSVVLNEAKFAEFVHEKANSRAGRPDHLGQSLLRDSRNYDVGLPLLTEIGQQQENSGQSFFARVEQLIDEIFLNPEIARQQVVDEKLRERGIAMKHIDHFSPRDPHDRAVVNRSRCRYSHSLAV